MAAGTGIGMPMPFMLREGGRQGPHVPFAPSPPLCKGLSPCYEGEPPPQHKAFLPLLCAPPRLSPEVTQKYQGWSG